MKNISRTVTLYCPKCGGSAFKSLEQLECSLNEAPSDTKIKCCNCNFNCLKSELIDTNKEVIDANIKEVKKEAIKEIKQEILKVLKRR